MKRLLCLVALTVALPAPARADHAPQPPLVPAARPELIVGEVRTARFKLLHTSHTAGTARTLAATIEGTRDRFAAVLGRDWPGVIEVRIGRGRSELEAIALPGGAPPTWASALAYPSHGIILLDALSLSEPAGVSTLQHELSHVALGQLGEGWPRWFQEGLAVHLSGEHRYRLAPYTTLSRAVRQKRLFELEGLSTRWPDHPADVEIAYAQSASFVAFLFSRHSEVERAALLEAVRGGASFEVAFAQAFRTTLSLEEEAWQKTLPARFAWLPLTLEDTGLFGVAALLCVLGYFRLRALTRRRRAEQAELEREEDAAEAALQAEEEAPAPPTEERSDEPPPTLH